MKRLMMLLMIAICAAMVGCAEQPAEEAAATTAEEPASTTAPVTHELRGVVVDRDPMANTLRVDHEAIGDWMGAMTMSFPVRGADVQDLPENGQSITGTIHVDGTEFWLSDVTLAKPAAEPAPVEESDTGGEEI